jgi:drug/metabolite transporter (DMT)-like permease
MKPSETQKNPGLNPVSRTHQRALWMMLLATAMWSIAGMVTRRLESAAGFEITLIRSIFAALTILCLWPFIHKGQTLLRALRSGTAVWIAGLCWAVMFTCFMMGLSLTTVANVLVAQSFGPIFTALLSWLWLKRKLSVRLWWVVAVAAAGVAVMFILDAQMLSGKHWLGFTVALGIPVASAINFNLVEKSGADVDFISAVFLGAVISALLMLPLAWPLQSSTHDVALLALLGVVQLGVPCAMCVVAAKYLPAPEMSLLSLLEVVFGIILAILFTQERPSVSTLIGGAMVVGALALNELYNLRQAHEQHRRA